MKEKSAEKAPVESIRVTLRLSVEKVKAIESALSGLGIVNLTSACNFLLNKGLEQSSAMAAAATKIGINQQLLEVFKTMNGTFESEIAELKGKGSSSLDTSPQVVTGFDVLSEKGGKPIERKR